MAGIGSESVVPLNVNAGAMLQQAIAPSQQIVNPNAVAALTDAFRKGQISADDIIARYGDVAKSKDKAEIQGLHEFISPEAIEARKAAASLMGEKAKEELALLPAHQQATEAKYQAEKLAAQRGDRAAIRAVAIKNGFGGLLSDDNDPDKDFSAYQKAVKYEAAKKGAEAIGKDIERKEYQLKKASGEIVTNPNKDTLKSKTSAINYTQDQAAKAHRLSMMTPEQFIAAGSPTVDEYVFGVEPKGDAAPSAPGVTSVDKLVTPAKRVTKRVTHANGDVEETITEVDSTEHPNPDASAVTPATPATPGKPTPDISGDVVIQEAKPGDTARPTEVQMRAQNALARFATSGDIIDSLEKEGFDPTSIGNWMNSFLPEVLKSGDRKAYDAAVNAWSQGLLRLESGAAISHHEQPWYNRAFFPQVNDPPNVVEEKRNLRNSIERVIAEQAQAGLPITPDSAVGQAVKKIYEQAEKHIPLPGKSTGQSFTTPSGTTFVEDPKNPGSYILQKAGAAPSPSVPTPATAPVPGTVRRISDIGGNDRY